VRSSPVLPHRHGLGAGMGQRLRRDAGEHTAITFNASCELHLQFNHPTQPQRPARLRRPSPSSTWWNWSSGGPHRAGRVRVPPRCDAGSRREVTTSYGCRDRETERPTTSTRCCQLGLTLSKDSNWTGSSSPFGYEVIDGPMDTTTTDRSCCSAMPFFPYRRARHLHDRLDGSVMVVHWQDNNGAVIVQLALTPSESGRLPTPWRPRQTDNDRDELPVRTSSALADPGNLTLGLMSFTDPPGASLIGGIGDTRFGRAVSRRSADESSTTRTGHGQGRPAARRGPSLPSSRSAHCLRASAAVVRP
jgi:hypothetical protein